MSDTPPDWVLIEAAKRCGGNYPLANLNHLHRDNTAFRALCDMIQKYEKPPVDRKLLCAREAVRKEYSGSTNSVERVAIRAIELWEEGFGRD